MSITRRNWLRGGAAAIGLQAVWPRAFASNSACPAFVHSSYPPLLQRFIQKLSPADDDFVSEQYAEQIGRILNEWSEELRRSVHGLDGLSGWLSEDIVASDWMPSDVKVLRTKGPLLIERRRFAGSPTKGRPAFVAGWTEYLRDFAKLETVELEIYGLRVVSEAPLRVEAELRCDLVGVIKNGWREQRVGSWVISWRQEQERWMAERWMANPEVCSRLIGPGFSEFTKAVADVNSPGMQQLGKGIDDWRTELDAACGIDVYGNHGIAVGDIDGSGFDSVYVCQPSGLPNRLYRHLGDGTFADITDTSGTGILDGTASAIFADFQNAGRQDLLVVRSGGPLLFVNKGEGRFEPRPDAFQFKHPPEGTFTSAAVADYDRNGLLDIYFCVYSYYRGLNQYEFPTPYYDAQNGPPNFLFRNRGDGTFEDVTAASGMDQNNNRFSFAAAWCDYDNNGWPDLYVANDFGRKNLYRSTGDGRFSDVAHEAGVEDYGPGMSVCWFDQTNDGLQDLYVANMWLMEGKRITANDNFLPDAPPAIRALYQKHNAGNSLYQNAGAGRFQDKTAEAGSAMARWSWSCAAWDFDHDGFDDLYVANGFVSGPNHADLQSFFWRQVARRSLTVAGASHDYEMAWNAVNELIRTDYSWSGYERNVFYANNHDGTFSDISGVLGLDLRDDSRAYALSDFNHDGRLEFVLKNRTGPQIRFLQNDMQDLGNAVIFRLEGKKSNRDAIGAAVRVEVAGRVQAKFISAGSGFASQHTKELHFGVGEVSTFVSASVLWPTGMVEHYANVPVNCRVEIEEGGADFKATPFQARALGNKEVTPAKVATADAPNVSTWLVAPVFGPNSTLPGLSAFIGAPVLLTFFRPDCSDGSRQLEQLQLGVGRFLDAGLKIAPVALTAASSSLPVMIADEQAAGAWNVFYRYLFDRRRDMLSPTSFLLDKTGAVIRVYRGFTAPDAILKDWKSAPVTSAERLARALPFSGPYFGNAMAHNYFTDGTALVEYGYTGAARDAFERVVEADPKHAGAWFNLGTIYLGQKQYKDARRCLDESVRLNPNDADAWNNLGMISGESGNYDQALIEFQKAARANPNHLLAVQNMMRIYQYQGRASDAQKVLEELLAKASDNAGLHLAYGMTLVAQNQMSGALDQLETSVRLEPNNPDALNDLGALLMRVGKNEEALKWFERCLQIAPDFDRPVINLAILYKGDGKSAKARQVLQDFNRKHPDNADVRNALDKLATN